MWLLQSALLKFFQIMRIFLLLTYLYIFELSFCRNSLFLSSLLSLWKESSQGMQILSFKICLFGKQFIQGNCWLSFLSKICFKKWRQNSHMYPLILWKQMMISWWCECLGGESSLFSFLFLQIVCDMTVKLMIIAKIMKTGWVLRYYIKLQCLLLKIIQS